MLPHDDQGSGTTVLLLHAGIADRSMWREHVEWLAREGYRAIAVDLPGVGEAPAAAGRAGAGAPWEDVLDTLRDLDVPRAVLVGNSFGAAVALRVAVIAPAAVSALLLVSPPPLADDDPSDELTAAWEAEETALERGDVEAAVTAVIEAWLGPDAPERLRERVATMQRRAFELQLEAAGPEEAPDPLAERLNALDGLSIPVMAVAGETDMADFKLGAREIAQRVPQGRCELLPGARHLAPLEAPEEFRRVLIGFLDGLE